LSELRSYWVSEEVERGRTLDHRIRACSIWTAGWLWRQLHPSAVVVIVREVPKAKPPTIAPGALPTTTGNRP